jgi:DNA-directed RNA polymerase subunit K/omega
MLQTRARQMSGEATPPPQPDESPIDKSTSAAKLEKSLKQRPVEKELKERNILKSMSPSTAHLRMNRKLTTTIH